MPSRPLSVLLVGAALAGAAGPGSPPVARAAAEPLDSLRARVEARIAATQREAPDAFVGVAWRDLATGRTLDVHGDSVFHAASTMKVPVMIELMRQVDRGALSLDQEILLVNRFASIADGSPYTLDAGDDSDSSAYALVGRRVAVRELMRRMIVRSSNLATNALIALADPVRVTATAASLGASPRTRVLRGVEDGVAYRRGLNNVVTANDLAVLLAAIEQRRAASPASCAEMRRILLAQELDAGSIPAGVPPGTPVAHKSGQITATLHDAAIVYPPGRAPYVLVVLTRGIPDEPLAARTIADVSRLAWEYATR